MHLRRHVSLCLSLSFCMCLPISVRAQPSLVFLDSTRIIENDKVYVGRPNSIAAAADRTVFISDIADRKVVRVDRQGRLTIVAHRGDGPGEVTNPTSVAVLGDTMVVIKNTGRRRLEYFDAKTLLFHGGVLVNWPSLNLSAWKGSLLVGSLRLESATSFALLDDLARPPVLGGVIPGIFRRNPLVAKAFGSVEVARDDSTVVEIFEVSNTMYRWNIVRKSIDSIELSVRSRRGAKPKVIDEIFREPAKAASLGFMWSFPMFLANVSNERTLVVFNDPTLKGSVYEGPSYLQLVDWRRHVSCDEIKLPVPSDVVPRFAIRGDTLIAVVQHAEEVDGVSSWILRWRIGASRC